MTDHASAGERLGLLPLTYGRQELVAGPEHLFHRGHAALHISLLILHGLHILLRTLNGPHRVNMRFNLLLNNIELALNTVEPKSHVIELLYFTTNIILAGAEIVDCILQIADRIERCSFDIIVSYLSHAYFYYGKIIIRRKR
jgi:hypothetical protein